MIFVGIDPGKSGGIAYIRTDASGKIFDTLALPLNSKNLLGFSLLLQSYDKTERIVVLEQVHSMPGQGVASMFTFGEGFGYIKGVLEKSDVEYELVPPAKWKKALGVTSEKQTSIDKAKELFPDTDFFATPRCKKESDGLCEAMLMAEYGRMEFLKNCILKQ